RQREFGLTRHRHPLIFAVARARHHTYKRPGPKGASMRHPFRAAVVLAALMLAGPGRAADAIDLDAAKREGKVGWYTSLPIALSQKLAGLFEQKSGIKVELFRSGGSAILRRFLQERDAGRVLADVLYTADPAATASLAAKDAFVAFQPKNFDRIADVAKDP